MRPADPAFYQALGRFIDAFAMTETALFQLLSFYVGIDSKMASAILSGVRIDGSISYIRRIMAMKDPGSEPRQELELLFGQLKEIADARNDIVHYWSYETSDAGRIVSNETRAHIPENRRERQISAEILDAMRADLHTIIMHINLHLRFPDPKHAGARLIGLTQSGAWRYMPPSTHRKKAPKSGRKDRARNKPAQ